MIASANMRRRTSGHVLFAVMLTVIVLACGNGKLSGICCYYYDPAPPYCTCYPDRSNCGGGGETVPSCACGSFGNYSLSITQCFDAGPDDSEVGADGSMADGAGGRDAAPSDAADGGQDGEGGGSALGPACPSAAPITGDGCSLPGAICVYSGCTACVCESDGRWACPGAADGCEACPVTVGAGESCNTNSDQQCTQWEFGGGDCWCDGGKWFCPTPFGVGGPSSCPDPIPQDGTSCGGQSISCVYGWPSDCVQASCSCSSGQWSCSYNEGGCADAVLTE